MKKRSHVLMFASFLFIIAGVIALWFNCCDFKSLCCCDEPEEEDEVYM